MVAVVVAAAAAAVELELAEAEVGLSGLRVQRMLSRWLRGRGGAVRDSRRPLPGLSRYAVLLW